MTKHVDKNSLVHYIADKFPKFSRNQAFVLALIGVAAATFFYWHKEREGDQVGRKQTTDQQVVSSQDVVQINSISGGSSVVLSPSHADPYKNISTDELIRRARESYDGKNGARNYTEAVNYLEEAVKRGDSDAITLKGIWKYTGVAYPKDRKEAERLWTQAASQQMPQLLTALGSTIFNLWVERIGQTGPRSTSTAFITRSIGIW